MGDEGALLESLIKYGSILRSQCPRPHWDTGKFSEDSSTNLKYISFSNVQIETWGRHVEMDLKRGSSKLAEAVPSPVVPPPVVIFTLQML